MPSLLAGRLARLQREFSPAQLSELKELAGGQSFPDLAHHLLNACDPDAQVVAAQKLAGDTGEPSQKQVKQAADQRAQDAVTPFLNHQRMNPTFLP